MTIKFRNKILYILLPMILIIGIYGSQTSNELSGYLKLYAVKASNDILAISIDKSSYKPGQTISIAGKVNHFDEGTRVIIMIAGPDKSIVGNFNSFVDRYGNFVSFYDIPDTVSSGKYVLTSYYDGDSHKKQVSLVINISDDQNGIAYILIPQGAESEANKLNFDPPTVNVTQGSEIIFINNDAAMHTVNSGYVKDDGTFSTDNRFNTIYLAPGDKTAITLPPGKYSYFDKFYPWLGGSITVKANPVPAKIPLKASTTPAKTKLKTGVNATSTAKIKSKPSTTGINTKVSRVGGNATTKTKTSTKSITFPVSTAILTEIWKERKDLQKLYPEVAHGKLGNLTKWATSTGWNQDKRLSALIPRGKVPAYLDNVLITIWKERKDLQKLYPEVAHGNISNLTKWATSTGWSQDSRLSELIPSGQKPKY